MTWDETNRHDFDDHKCIFRCLALHQGGSICGLERKNDQLKQEFERYANISFDDGVEIVQLPALEVYFNVSMNVLQQDGTAKVLHLSKLEFEVVPLNLFENHFSYIKHFSKYAKKLARFVKGFLISVVILNDTRRNVLPKLWKSTSGVNIEIRKLYLKN